ncbi:hypothetical protein H0A73_00655 [Alcaligenaceae bacterium]|nr:hypothetical protein [Alcaligenaceae bacterium]
MTTSPSTRTFSKDGAAAGSPGLRPGFRSFATVCVAAVLAACAGPQPERAPPPPPETACTAAGAGDPLVGNWLSVRRQAGVVGELRTLISLHADGTMSYGEQLSRPGKAPQGLGETGCWQRDGGELVLRTVESNGSPVDLQDPIYVNRYRITREPGERVGLRAPDGADLNARRMPPDYRLPL